jgi:hypothetical protein
LYLQARLTRELGKSTSGLHFHFTAVTAIKAVKAPCM